MPENRTRSIKRVRVTKCRTAREGGNRARADFQVTPPLGRSIFLEGTPAALADGLSQAELGTGELSRFKRVDAFRDV